MFKNILIPVFAYATLSPFAIATLFFTSVFVVFKQTPKPFALLFSFVLLHIFHNQIR